MLLELIGSLSFNGVPVDTFLGQRGKPQILFNGFTYCCAKLIRDRGYWVCSREKSRKCRARLISDSSTGLINVKKTEHTHEPEYDKHDQKNVIKLENKVNTCLL